MQTAMLPVIRAHKKPDLMPTKSDDTPAAVPNGTAAPSMDKRIKIWDMHKEADLHYIISCAFLFYVFMCGTLLEDLIGINVREYIQNNEIVKHVLGLIVLIFTIGFVADLPSLATLVWSSAIVYIWFLVMSKIPAQYNMLVVLVLIASFALNEIIRKTYSPEWVYSTDDAAKQAQRTATREHLISISHVMAIVTLALSFVLMLWFLLLSNVDALVQLRLKKRGKCSGLTYFVLQPDAHPWVLSRRALHSERLPSKMVAKITRRLRDDDDVEVQALVQVLHERLESIRALSKL